MTEMNPSHELDEVLLWPNHLLELDFDIHLLF